MMKRILIFGVCAATLFAGTPGAARIGVYHWGGQHTRSVGDGVNAIARLGGHVARVALSARYYRDYNMAAECRPDFSLTAAAQDRDIKRAFDNAAIDVIILTAYDGITWGDCGKLNFLDPAFFTPAHTAAIVQEYSDFTLYLYRTYRHTHKRFVIANWESDNSVYCGQAYAFAVDPVFRTTCRARYTELIGIASPEDALRGFKMWFQARAQGVAEGRSRAQAECIGGNRVFTAAEINIVRALHEAGIRSVLYDVLPFVMFDYVSYSAWESINRDDPAKELLADLDTIQEVTGSSAIIVGESGFLRNDRRREDIASTNDVIVAALTWGVDYYVQWNLYDTDPAGTLGLYDLAGQPTPLADWFQSRFRMDESALNQLRETNRNRQPATENTVRAGI